MRDAAPNVDVLRWFQTLGVDIVVDDFGIGYSNLVYIKCFPLDVLKRDESFVEGMDEDTGDTVIVEAVVGLTRALVMSTVAGGIETDGQAELLQTLGCDVGQGYYFAEPLPAWEARILPPRTLNRPG